MGTNFYWIDNQIVCPNPCAHCNQEPIHVGKRSAGWSFGFRGWRDAEESPFGIVVDTRKVWAHIMRTRSGILRNEYGDIEENPLAWIELLKPPDDATFKWENSVEACGPYRRDDDPNAWRDPERFRFSDREFS